MTTKITPQRLVELGMTEVDAATLADEAGALLASLPAPECWSTISRELLSPDVPFEVHLELYDAVFVGWKDADGPRPAWLPTDESIAGTNIGRALADLGLSSYAELHAWSVEDRARFWGQMAERLGIVFKQPPTAPMDASADELCPEWYPGAKLNITDSCFGAPRDSAAIVYRDAGGIKTVTVAELEALVNRVANSLVAAGFAPGDALAIDMPMTVECVAIYLGIVRAGCAAVSIAESFAPEEIAKRLRLGKAKAIFTQDFISYGAKKLPLYEKVTAANAPRAIVLGCDGAPSVDLRAGDLAWDEFLGAPDAFESVARAPGDVVNVLFSSGTTGDPKAIPWLESTPLKCASDACFHHDVRPGDVVAWPTSLGWMMGPWLVYASLLNRATMALHYGAPNTREFGEFVQDAHVTMLGVVPSLVKAWRKGDTLAGLDWSRIRCFSSTGECSNAEDMLWLMSRAGYSPVIEYCGGTEVAGGYVTGTLAQAASPATFSTPAMGLDFVLLDENGAAAETGEVFLVPPSVGLSSKLLNRDHHEVYFKDVPPGPNGEKLRRHGDDFERLPGGYFRARGRVDDTMNLGGIKVSSAEIERTLNPIEGVLETAAVAISPPGGGASVLVVFTVLESGATLETDVLKKSMQHEIRAKLNPLFKVHDVVITDALPRTASNKVMRRKLRAAYKPGD
jgi:acetyl-CoA synthetase